MDKGCGTLGHRAQHRADQELGLEHLILALDHFMLGCHAPEVQQTLKAAKVYTILKSIFSYCKLVHVLS